MSQCADFIETKCSGLVDRILFTSAVSETKESNIVFTLEEDESVTFKFEDESAISFVKF